MAAKNGEVTLKVGFYSEGAAASIGASIESLCHVMGDAPPMMKRILTMLWCIYQKKVPALESCECYKMALTDYPVICNEHLDPFSLASPSKFISVGKCNEHGVHWVAMAFGAGFRVDKFDRPNTLEGAVAFLDNEVSNEDAVAALVERYRTEHVMDKASVQGDSNGGDWDLKHFIDTLKKDELPN